MVTTISLDVQRQGLHLISPHVAEAAHRGSAALSPDESGGSGLCTLFLRHTSASLLIQENASPDAQHDLEAWLNRLVPERDPLYTHNDEGPDDMPAHIKATLTATSLSIPIINGQLALGRWQGIFLWEHRRSPHTREIVIHIGP